MAGWFRRIFGAEEDEQEEYEAEEQTVELSALDSWVETRSNSEFARIQPKIESQITRLHDEKARLKEVLKDLSVAQLHNPDIPAREMQIMEGNREAYIKQHKQFLNQIDITEDAGCMEVARFCKEFEEMLVALAKSTAKGHAIMGAFFANHANNVNRSIKTMGDTVGRMRETLEDGNVGVDHIDDVRKAAAALRGKHKLLREIDEELAILRKKLDNSRQMKEKINKQTEQLKQTEDYSEYQSSNTEREGLWKTVKQAENDADTLFSPLSRAMKKYERVIVEDAALFTRYMDSPMKALAEDEQLRILAILAKMKASLKEGTLELKDSDKAVQRIDEVTRQKLETLREDYMTAKAEIKRIDNRMRDSRVLNELDDLRYKMEHVDNQIQLLQDKIAQAGKTKEKIDLEELKTSVAEKVKDVFGIEVNITWEDQSSEA